MPEIYGPGLWESRIPARHRALARADTAVFEYDGVHTAFPHEWSDGVDLSEADDRDRWQIQNVWASDNPLADRAVKELALVAIDELNLGQRDERDYLALSFSATDRVGHQFGPFSPEVMSTLLELDELLGDFFDYLDEEVGENAWIVGLSADHGVVTMPEYAATHGSPWAERRIRAEVTAELTEIINAPAQKYERKGGKKELLRPGLIDAVSVD